MGTKVDVASADIFMVKVKTEIIYQRGYKAKPASKKGYTDDPLLRYYTIKIVITKGKVQQHVSYRPRHTFQANY